MKTARHATIHFLKIDVEGTEAEVLEGLNLEQVRPWIIVSRGDRANFRHRGTVQVHRSDRENWEHLIIDCRYGFAYFDGLNCFYVADEVAALKERLAVPPNVFDDFVRFPEWAIRQQAAELEQANCRPARTRERLGSSMEGRAGAKRQSAQRAARHRSKTAENGNICKRSRQDHLLGRVHQLEAQLAVPSVDRAIGRALKRVQETGDRLTGGGMRSLARRALTTLVQRSMRDRRLMALGRAVLKPFPKVATTLYQLATREDAVATSSIPSPAGSLSSDDAATVAALPASARSTYLRLKAAMSEQRRLEPDPMRIVLDLQGAQSESRFRGIGRYSLALADAMIREGASTRSGSR